MTDGTKTCPNNEAYEIYLERICSDDLSRLHVANNDIDVGNPSLEMLWTKLEGKKLSRAHRYFQWDLIDCAYYIMTEIRLHKMVRRLFGTCSQQRQVAEHR